MVPIGSETIITDIATCYHEAGHAVVAYMLGGEVRQLSLGGEADDVLPERMGECRVAWPSSDDIIAGSIHQHRLRQILTLLAGPLTEQIIDDDDAIFGWSDDVGRAEKLAVEMTGDAAAAEQFLKLAVSDLRRVLNQERYWNAIAALADELDAHQWLECEEVHAVLEFWLAR